MDHPIISVEMIKTKARADHARGVTVCPLPPYSPAAATWRAEIARLDAEDALDAAEEVAA